MSWFNPTFTPSVSCVCVVKQLVSDHTEELKLINGHKPVEPKQTGLTRHIQLVCKVALWTRYRLIKIWNSPMSHCRVEVSAWLSLFTRRQFWQSAEEAQLLHSCFLHRRLIQQLFGSRWCHHHICTSVEHGLYYSPLAVTLMMHSAPTPPPQCRSPFWF